MANFGNSIAETFEGLVLTDTVADMDATITVAKTATMMTGLAAEATKWNTRHQLDS